LLLKAADLRKIVSKSYEHAGWRDPAVTPVMELVPDKMYILELFHGPTFAFKDVALQVIPSHSCIVER
jgi:threonine synthase